MSPLEYGAVYSLSEGTHLSTFGQFSVAWGLLIYLACSELRIWHLGFVFAVLVVWLVRSGSGTGFFPPIPIGSGGSVIFVLRYMLMICCPHS